MAQIIFATGNKWKVHEVEQAIKPFNIEVDPLEIDFVEPVGDVITVAASKAMQAYAKCHKPVIVCDSGFYVDHHPKGSGYPATLVKRLGYVANPQKMLDEMANVSCRSCHFQTCLAYYNSDEFVKPITFVTTVFGNMTYDLRQVNNPGCCGCYRLFIPQGSKLAWSEMSEEELMKEPTDIMRAAAAFASWYTDKK